MSDLATSTMLWQQLNDDPRFRQMSYDEQMHVRARWIQMNMPKVEEFRKLSPASQAKVFQGMVTQAPSLMDTSAWSDKALSFARAIGSPQDQEAYRDATDAAAAMMIHRNFADAAVLHRIANAMGGDALTRGDERAEFVMHKPDKDKDPDEYKAYRYLSDTYSSAENKTHAWATFVGTLSNVLSMRAVGTGMFAGAKALGAQAAAKYGTGPASKWLMKTVTPHMIEWGLDSTFLTAADVMANKLVENTRLGIPNRAENFAGQVAINFGSNFLLDMAMFSLFTTVGQGIKAATKVTRWRGLTEKTAKFVSTEDYGEAVARVMSGEKLNRAQFLSFDKEVQDTLIKLQREIKALAKLAPETTDDLVSGLIRRQGYELVREKGAYVVRKIITESPLAEVKGRFTSPIDALGGLFKAHHVTPDIAARAMDSLLSNDTGIKKVLKLKLTGEPGRLDTDTIAYALLPDRGGKLNKKAIETATKSLLMQAGAGKTKLAVQAIPEQAYFEMADKARQTADTLFVPQGLHTAEQMQKFLGKYAQDIGRFIPDGPPAAMRYLTDVVEQAPKLETGINPAFVEALAKKNKVEYLRRPDGLFQVGDETARSVAEASDILQRKILLASEENIKEGFKQFRFKFENVDGTWSVRGPHALHGGNLLTSGHRDVESAAREMIGRGFMPKLSQRHAANIVIDPSGAGLEVWEGMIRGPAEYVRDYAAKFVSDDAGLSDVLFKIGDSSIVQGSNRHLYKVIDTKWGITRQFTSVENAVKYLNKKWDSIESLREMAYMKGMLEVTPTGNGIVTRDLDGTTRLFKSVKDLSDHLKTRAVDPTWQKEIMNIDRSVIDTVMDSMTPAQRELYGLTPGMPKPIDFDDLLNNLDTKWKLKDPTAPVAKLEATEFRVRNLLQQFKDQFQTPTYARVRRYVGQNNIDTIGEVFEGMEKANKNYRGLMAQWNDLLRGTTKFKHAPGRSRRAKLLPLFEKPQSEWAGIMKSQGLELTDADVEFMNRARILLDNAGKYFNIEPYKMLSEYLPRLREFIADPRNLDGVSMASDIVKKMPFRHAKEMEFFSSYLRADELVTMVRDTDPLNVIGKYLDKGIKNMTLGKAYANNKVLFDRAMASGAFDTDGGKQAVDLINHYLEEVMGMYTDEASKMARHVAAETTNVLNRAMGNSPEKAKLIQDWVSTIHGLAIANTMSFRPWTIIRNMMQPWVTLAPMYGNDALFGALKKMGNEKLVTEAHKRLRDSGRLLNKVPAFGMLYDGKGAIGLFNKIGMRLYMHSDDYTRVMTDFVVRDTLTDAVAKLNSGALGTGAKASKKFMKLANLNRLDDFDQRKVLDLLQNKGFESAADYMGDVVTRETMFAYTAGSNAPMFKGMWGRLFGMMGHWPAYYAQTLANGLRRGSLLDKAQFAGRVAMNSAALWYTFDQVLGIRADNFVPWKTMFHDGGPYFDLITDTLSAAAGSPGAPGWSQVMNRGAMLMLPGYGIFNAWKEGAELARAGKYYEGYLRMLAVPLSPSRRL